MHTEVLPQAPSSMSDPTPIDPSHLEILLIAINYAPEPTGSGPYTAGLAEHYAQLGHRVRVVTGLPHYPAWRRMRGVPMDYKSNPAVKRYTHFIPKRPKPMGRLLYEATWLASASRSLVNERPDVVIGIMTNVSGGVLAWISSMIYQVPFGLVFQDLAGPGAAQIGYRGGSLIAPVVARAERFLACRAQRVAIVAEGFRPYLEEAGVPPTRIDRVRNWARWTPPSESVQMARQRLGWGRDEFICLHAGNMGQKQGLENLLIAAGLLRGENTRIVLAGHGNDRDRLMGLSRRLCLSNVSFVDLQPPGGYESMLKAADVLLLNQRGSVRDMALPSKLTSYFAASRPVVAAVARGSNAAREVRFAKAGVVVEPDKPAELVRVIRDLRRHPSTAQAFAERGSAYANQYLGAETAYAEYDGFLTGLISGKLVEQAETVDRVVND